MTFFYFAFFFALLDFCFCETGGITYSECKNQKDMSTKTKFYATSELACAIVSNSRYYQQFSFQNQKGQCAVNDKSAEFCVFRERFKCSNEIKQGRYTMCVILDRNGKNQCKVLNSEKKSTSLPGARYLTVVQSRQTDAIENPLFGIKLNVRELRCYGKHRTNVLVRDKSYCDHECRLHVKKGLKNSAVLCTYYLTVENGRKTHCPPQNEGSPQYQREKKENCPAKTNFHVDMIQCLNVKP